MKESPKVMFPSDNLCCGSCISNRYNGSLFVQTVHVDTLSGATTVLYTFTIDRGVSFEVSYILKPLFCFSLEISSTYMNLVIFQFDSALVLRLHLLTTALLFIFSIANVS